jgi:hypothetical protein
MNSDFINHLQRNWPLTIVVLGLVIYIPVTLISGVFYINQGRILKSAEPARYWKWVAFFIALHLSSVVTLVGSFFLSSK